MSRPAILVLALIGASPAPAQIAPPVRKVETGVVDIATSVELAPVLEQVAAVYQQSHAAARIRIAPVGSNVAFSRLTTARADFAIVGRVIADQEAKGFEWAYLEPPLGQALFRGSDCRAGHSPRISVIAAKASPIRSLTMAELAARLVPGGKGRVFMPDAESGTGRYLRHKVLRGATQLDWARINEVEERDHHRPGAVADEIAREVARDAQAIGIADCTARKGVRVVPVSDAGVQLDRQVMAYAHPSRRAEAADFLAYLQGEAGQAIIAAGPYRPLK